MIVTHKIKMDLSEGGEMPRINIVQNDKYTRNIEISLFSDGKKWLIPEGITGVVHYLKPDGTGGSYDVLPDGATACITTDNTLTIALAPQVCTAEGIVRLAVSMIKGQAELHTFSILVYVRSNPEINSASETYVSLSGVLPYGNWTPNMFLGTDANGNVVVKNAPEGSGTTGNGGYARIEILDADPADTELYDGRMWILRAGQVEAYVTAPVITLAATGENSIVIELSNASYDEQGNFVNTYRVYLNGTMIETVTLSAGSTYTFTGLTAGETYAVKVIGVNGSVVSPDSNILSVTLESGGEEEPDIPEPDVPDTVSAVFLKNQVAVSSGGTALGSSGNIKFNSRTDRMVAVTESGEKCIVDTSDADTVYYPIPVPADASGVVIECAGLSYGFNGWAYADGVYTYKKDSGWKTSGTSYTFTPGEIQYATIGFKSSGSTIDSYDTSTVKIEFTK